MKILLSEDDVCKAITQYVENMISCEKLGEDQVKFIISDDGLVVLAKDQLSAEVILP